jgi:transglutaminase-like putative cysteine protease
MIFHDPPLDLTIRCGLDLIYEAMAPTPMVMVVKPRIDRWQHIEKELFTFDPHFPVEEHEDEHGNMIHRIILPPGQTRVKHDAFVAVSSVTENYGAVDQYQPDDNLPIQYLRYLLPSRYCDSDKLRDFAQQHFGHVQWGLQLVQAICNWVHTNIEYRFGGGSPLTSASDIIRQGYGVCRDFAHTAVALCRTFNIPSRYVTGYVPDVACWDPGTPMDFHAYFEVFIGGRWQTFDARFNTPRIGRIKIACGLDAVDGAFSTLYGNARLTHFLVWAYQVDPQEVNLGDPIDLSKRLCGTPQLLYPPRWR